MYESTRLAFALRMGRAALGVNQQTLADLIGVSKAVVTRNERPDMAMRADTLVRLMYVMRQRRIDLDIFSTLDSVVFYTDQGNFQAIALRVTRAALGLSQQELGDLVGVSKSVIARGEKDNGDLKSSVMTGITQAAFEAGIKIGYPSIVRELIVEVYPNAIAALAAKQGDDADEDAPKKEIVPLTMQEIVDREHPERFKTVSRKKGQEGSR